MKVLVVHTIYILKGGEDSVVDNEVELLRSNGVEVELLKFSNSGNTFLKVIQLPFNYSSYLKTKRSIRLFKPDIVHIHNLHFAGSASVIYAINQCKIPIVMTLHNYRLLCPSATLFYKGKIFTDSIKQIFSWQAVIKGVYLNSKALTFWVACSQLFHEVLGTWKLSNKYIALGQYTEEIFKNSKLSYIIPNMVIKPNFCYQNPNKKNVIGNYYLYVGRLSEEKGIITLLNAFSENKLPLKIAGTGPLEQEVIKYGQVFTNIEFLGSVNNEDVSDLLTNAIALIFSSQWFETFGMVIIEAFSSGVPVIASDIGQLKITIKNKYNGLCFESGNKDDLKEKVAYYENLSTEDKQIYRVNAFKCYQENYSPQKNAIELISIYNDLLVEQSLKYQLI